MTITFVKKLQNFLFPFQNSSESAPMSAYMRNLFPFLGIKTPKRAELLRAFLKENGKPAADELEAVVRELWALPEREYQYIALALLEKQSKALPRDAIGLFENLIADKSWWDTVDVLAAHLVGAYFRQHPEQIPVYIEKWLSSDNLWLRRTAILFQLSYKGATDLPLLFQIIDRCLPSDEFFIQKAIGWALREYTKTDPAPVLAFLESRQLPPLSRREALKVLERKKQREHAKS
ncbi:DNA alkylation repair protein [Brevibacillus fluminis]|uniref:DNA alkylation repair protein n=1 Tax=Brevibacillus fluminis TaxID=511487 RepID=A0A3M8DD68_9BACL|nr:DNA alkylation repair protein [Brevibacillus fluminis]RNB85976.1 DNA alkylation repair protein [Brevibacillus fluminis]